MEWSAVMWIVFAVAGAGLIAGGIVAYRKGGETRTRALGAAAVGAGLMMWAVVALTMPASNSDNASPDPDVTFEQATP